MAENLVLLLEDDPAAQAAIKGMLPGGKFELIEATDSKTALNIIKRDAENLRLMVIKFKMPQVPGWKIVQKAQTHPRVRTIPIVLVASAGDAVSQAFPKAPEFFEIIQYPCDRPQMQRAIKSAVAKAKRPRPDAPPPAAKKRVAPPPPPPAARKAAPPPPPPAAKKRPAAPPPPPPTKKAAAPAAARAKAPPPAQPQPQATPKPASQPVAKPAATKTASQLVFEPVPYSGGDPFAVGDRIPAVPDPSWQSDDPFAVAIAAGKVPQVTIPAATTPDPNDPFVVGAAPAASPAVAVDPNDPFLGEYVPDPFDPEPETIDDQDPFAVSANFKSPPAMPPPSDAVESLEANASEPDGTDPLAIASLDAALDADRDAVVDEDDDPFADAITSLELASEDLTEPIIETPSLEPLTDLDERDPLAGAIDALMDDGPDGLPAADDADEDDPFGGAVMSLGDELASEPKPELEPEPVSVNTVQPAHPDPEPTAELADATTAVGWGIPYGDFECLHQQGEARDRGVTGLVIGPDGALYTCGPELYLCRWYLYELAKEQQFDLFSKGSECLTLSPDGQVLLTGAAKSNIKLWDAINGTLMDTLSDHSMGVVGLALSPDSRTVITCAAETNIKLWDYSTGAMQGPLNDESFGATAIALTPDGQTVLTSSHQSNIRFWDWSTGELLGPLNIQSFGVTSLVVSPDGQAVISGDERGMLTITSLATGEPIRTMKAHDEPITAVAVSPDGWYIVTASPLEMKLWGCWPEEA